MVDNHHLHCTCFVLKAPGDEKKKKDKGEKKKRDKPKRDKTIEEDSDEDGEGWETVDRGAVEKPKMFDKDTEITHEAVIKKLHEIMAARGKKRTNRKEQIELLLELYKVRYLNHVSSLEGRVDKPKINADIICIPFLRSRRRRSWGIPCSSRSSSPSSPASSTTTPRSRSP